MDRNYDDLKNIVGLNVLRLRKTLGMTQTLIAEKMAEFDNSMNASTISKIENGTRKVSDKEAFTLAKILNVDLNELFKVHN